MALLDLKTDFRDGDILYGEDLNRTNEQVEAAFNISDASIQDLLLRIVEILPDAEDYTDEQIRLAVQDFAMTQAYLSDIEDINERITEVKSVSDYTFDSINTFVNVTFINAQEILRAQLDGKIESFFQDEDPYESWDEADREAHDGDMWYSITEKTLKRYDFDLDAWTSIVLKNIKDSYENASRTKGAEDGLITTFVTTPIPPYDIQDLFPDGGTVNLKICKVARATGDYNATDWELASKYADDSGLNSFISDNYNEFVNSVNGLTTLYYSYNDPSIDWDTTAKKDLHVGSIWKNKNTNIVYKYDKSDDETPVYSWIADSVPDNMFDIIDGKKGIYTQMPSRYEKDDIFIVPPLIDDMPAYVNVGDILVASADGIEFSWEDWNKKDNSISEEIMNSALNPIITSLEAATNDLDLNAPGSKLSQIVQTINSVTTNFLIKGGSNLFPNSLQLFESVNSDIFEKTGTWEIRQNGDISTNTVSKFMNYCVDPGKIKWVIKTMPNTAYTISLVYNNDYGDTSTLKLTNGNVITLINETEDKAFETYSYGFVANSNTITVEIETTGDNFGYSDLMLNYGALIDEETILPNALKWQPAPGENFGTIIKMSYEGQEITMKNGLFKHVMDNTGDRIILVSTGETVTEFDEEGISTPIGIFRDQISVGIFTVLNIDTENQIEF